MRSVLRAVLCAAALAAGCEAADEAATTDEADAAATDATDGSDGTDGIDATDTGAEIPPLRPASAATEYVAMTAELALGDEDPAALLQPLIGSVAASAGELWTLEIQPGFYLHSEPDPRTPNQAILSVTMDVSGDAAPNKRTILRVPASFDYGSVFIDTVEAAMARAGAAKAPEDHRPFRLEYRSQSAVGGALVLALDWRPSGAKLIVDARTPITSLEPGRVNEPARVGEPFESIYGLVVFELTRDNFDFFATRAYGVSAGKSQNFKDFQLLPHSWLRLTVTPQLDDELINVEFEVVTTDDRRLALAAAPASMRAGEQFMQSVFRLVDNMEAIEAEAPGMSPRWEVPYYYDDPNGGGVVEVIATGEAGTFSIAYAVETPVNYLQDVESVGYQGAITIPDDWDAVDPTCSELGSEPSSQGFFEVTFAASTTVTGSKDLDGELRGPIRGSVFRAEDVTIAGPNEGAKAVASFHFEDVDLRNGPSETTYRIETPVLAGDYQILGFMDIDGNSDPNDAGPDKGDPVMIPIGGYSVECAVQPVTAELAILLP